MIEPNRENPSPITHVYLAGPYLSRDTVKAFAEDVWKAGFIVTSRWHDGPKMDPSKRDRTLDQRICAQNYHDLLNSDVVIAVANADIRGTIAEVGAAIAAGKTIILIGEPNTVTLMLDRPGSTYWAANPEEALEMLVLADAPEEDEGDDEDDE